MPEDKSYWVIGLMVAAMAIAGLVLKPGVDDVAAPAISNITSATAPTVAPDTTIDIAKRADDIPPPITRAGNELVKIELTTSEVVSEIMPGVTYKYWTYNGTVPGPFLRVKEGDDVELTLKHGEGSVASGEHNLEVVAFDTIEEAQSFIGARTAHAEEGHSHGDAHTPGMASHDAEGHGTHSIDLHAVYGPGGGAAVTQVGHDGPKTFRFKATRSGIYVYHCASPHIPTHIANGMYGLILVEPEQGMEKVDREFYIMQGELYTSSPFGVPGHQSFVKAKMDKEEPEYFVYNGRVGALTGERAMRAKTGETIRLYVGVGTFVASNFHIIGGVLDRLYPEGDLISPPHRNVQTTVIPAGGATMIEFTPDVPGTYVLVDHSLTRSIDKGAVAEIIVEGDARPDLFTEVES